MINHDPIYHRCWPIGLLVALLAFCDGNPLTVVESPSQSDSNITVSSYGPDGVSNYQPLACLLNRLFGHRSKKTSNRVPTLSGKTGKWPFHGKWGKFHGICQAPQGILENRNISGKFGYGRFKCCFWEMSHNLSHVLPSVPKPSYMEAYIHFQYTNKLNFLSTHWGKMTHIYASVN